MYILPVLPASLHLFPIICKLRNSEVALVHLKCIFYVHANKIQKLQSQIQLTSATLMYSRHRHSFIFITFICVSTFIHLYSFYKIKHRSAVNVIMALGVRIYNCYHRDKASQNSRWLTSFFFQALINRLHQRVLPEKNKILTFKLETTLDFYVYSEYSIKYKFEITL